MHGNSSLRFVATTDKGLRQSNADAVFAGDKIFTGEEISAGKNKLAEKALFVVADGVGTSKNSGLASKMAVTRIRETSASGAGLTEAVQQAHAALREFNLQNTSEQPVGTTIVAASLNQTQREISNPDKSNTETPTPEIPQGNVVWVGDSRAYVIDLTANQVTQLTQDHSLVNKLVQRGDITSDEARSHPQRNVITRCLGLTQKNNLKVDSNSFSLSDNQVLLLCSDGLSGSVPESTLLQCLQNSDNLEDTADELVQLALKAGSRDNISLVLVAVA